ncbi:unnamed protein product [Closterium sp. NIES-65]|nr:unnamed protein product [Closterium sp. NIES-65]
MVANLTEPLRPLMLQGSMFKGLRGRVKEKFEFRFRFHATRIPLSGYDQLCVSVISCDSGRTEAQTTKSAVRNGICQWPETVTHVVKIARNPKTKAYEPKAYRFVVSTGGTWGTVLGEATLNLVDFIKYRQLDQRALPLAAGSVLHATLQSFPLDPREEEETADEQTPAGSTQAEGDEGDYSYDDEYYGEDAEPAGDSARKAEPAVPAPQGEGAEKEAGAEQPSAAQQCAVQPIAAQPSAAPPAEELAEAAAGGSSSSADAGAVDPAPAAAEAEPSDSAVEAQQQAAVADKEAVSSCGATEGSCAESAEGASLPDHRPKARSKPTDTTDTSATAPAPTAPAPASSSSSGGGSGGGVVATASAAGAAAAKLFRRSASLMEGVGAGKGASSPAATGAICATAGGESSTKAAETAGDPAKGDAGDAPAPAAAAGAAGAAGIASPAMSASPALAPMKSPPSARTRSGFFSFDRSPATSAAARGSPAAGSLPPPIALPAAASPAPASTKGAEPSAGKAESTLGEDEELPPLVSFSGELRRPPNPALVGDPYHRSVASGPMEVGGGGRFIPGAGYPAHPAAGGLHDSISAGNLGAAHKDRSPGLKPAGMRGVGLKLFPPSSPNLPPLPASAMSPTSCLLSASSTAPEPSAGLPATLGGAAEGGTGGRFGAFRTPLRSLSGGVGNDGANPLRHSMSDVLIEATRAGVGGPGGKGATAAGGAGAGGLHESGISVSASTSALFLPGTGIRPGFAAALGGGPSAALAPPAALAARERGRSSSGGGAGELQADLVAAEAAIEGLQRDCTAQQQTSRALLREVEALRAQLAESLVADRAAEAQLAALMSERDSLAKQVAILKVAQSEAEAVAGGAGVGGGTSVLMVMRDLEYHTELNAQLRSEVEMLSSANEELAKALQRAEADADKYRRDAQDLYEREQAREQAGKRAQRQTDEREAEWRERMRKLEADWRERMRKAVDAHNQLEARLAQLEGDWRADSLRGGGRSTVEGPAETGRGAGGGEEGGEAATGAEGAAAAAAGGCAGADGGDGAAATATRSPGLSPPASAAATSCGSTTPTPLITTSAFCGPPLPLPPAAAAAECESSRVEQLQRKLAEAEKEAQELTAESLELAASLTAAKRDAEGKEARIKELEGAMEEIIRATGVEPAEPAETAEPAESADVAEAGGLGSNGAGSGASAGADGGRKLGGGGLVGKWKELRAKKQQREQESIARLNAHVAELSDELDKRKADVINASAEVERLRGCLAAAEASAAKVAAEAEEEAAALRAEAARMQREAERAAEQRAELESEVAARGSQLAALQRRCEAADEERQQLAVRMAEEVSMRERAEESAASLAAQLHLLAEEAEEAEEAAEAVAVATTVAVAAANPADSSGAAAAGGASAAGKTALPKGLVGAAKKFKGQVDAAVRVEELELQLASLRELLQEATAAQVKATRESATEGARSKEVEQLQEEVAVWRVRAEGLERDLCVLETEKRAREGRISELGREAGEARMRAKAAEEEMGRLAARVSIATARAAAQEVEVRESRESKAAAAGMVQELEEALRRAGSERARADAELAEAVAARAALEQQITALEARVAELNVAAEGRGRSAADAAAVVAEAQRDAELEREGRRAAEEKAAAMEALRGRLQETVRREEELRQAAADRAEMLEGELRSVRERAAREAGEMRDMERKLFQRLEQVLAEKEEGVVRVTRLEEAVKRERAEKEVATEQLQTEVLVLKEQLQALLSGRSGIERTAAALAEEQAARVALEGRLRAAEAGAAAAEARWEAEMRELEGKVQSLQAERTQWRAREVGLAAELEVARGEAVLLQELSFEVQRLKEEKAAIENLLGEARGVNEALERAMLAAEREKRGLASHAAVLSEKARECDRMRLQQQADLLVQGVAAAAAAAGAAADGDAGEGEAGGEEGTGAAPGAGGGAASGRLVDRKQAEQFLESLHCKVEELERQVEEGAVLAAQLEDARAEIAAKQAELAAKQAEVAAKQAEVEERERRIKDLEACIAEVQVEAERQKAEWRLKQEAAEEVVAAKMEGQAAAERRIGEMRVQVVELEAEVERLQVEAAAATAAAEAAAAAAEAAAAALQQQQNGNLAALLGAASSAAAAAAASGKGSTGAAVGSSSSGSGSGGSPSYSSSSNSASTVRRKASKEPASPSLPAPDRTTVTRKVVVVRRVQSNRDSAGSTTTTTTSSSSSAPRLPSPSSTPASSLPSTPRISKSASTSSARPASPRAASPSNIPTPSAASAAPASTAAGDKGGDKGAEGPPAARGGSPRSGIRPPSVVVSGKTRAAGTTGTNIPSVSAATSEAAPLASPMLTPCSLPSSPLASPMLTLCSLPVRGPLPPCFSHANPLFPPSFNLLTCTLPLFRTSPFPMCPAFPPLLPLISSRASPHFLPCFPSFPPVLPLISSLASPHFLPCFPSFPPMLPLISSRASPHFPPCFPLFPSLLPLISPTAAPHFPPCFSSFPSLLLTMSLPASHHVPPCFSSFPSLLSHISYISPVRPFSCSPSQSLVLSPSPSLLQ